MSSAEQDRITVPVGPDTYLVEQTGGDLRIGRQAGSDVLWEDDTVPVDALPPNARNALKNGDTQAQELQLALRSVVEAFAQRGG